MNILKELRDQSAHCAVGAVAAIPVLLAPGILSCAWLFFVIGLVRETTEEGAPVTPGKVIYAARKSWWDLSWWTAFGALIGGLAA